jgi:hypothetical protein
MSRSSGIDRSCSPILPHGSRVGGVRNWHRFAVRGSRFTVPDAWFEKGEEAGESEKCVTREQGNIMAVRRMSQGVF